MRQREQAVFERGPISPRSVGANSSRNPNRKVRRSLSGVETLLDLQRTHGNAFVQRLVQRRLAVSQTGEQEADRG
jgi:hypothetical protein